MYLFGNKFGGHVFHSLAWVIGMYTIGSSTRGPQALQLHVYSCTCRKWTGNSYWKLVLGIASMCVHSWESDDHVVYVCPSLLIASLLNHNILPTTKGVLLGFMYPYY